MIRTMHLLQHPRFKSSSPPATPYTLRAFPSPNKSHMKRGAFILFEGCDRCGKSTQVALHCASTPRSIISTVVDCHIQLS